ncbi:MAG: hypothetical protein QOJ11_1421 [Frankiales bacterium]|jgi:photosystem II stability/assembly factor-like uncharacterized protein|nr:hypothetical protein [Frankiales bacterium]
MSVAALASGTVLASSVDGVWSSPDVGRTWRLTLPVTAAPTYEQNNVYRWLSRAGTGAVLNADTELYFTSNGTDWHSVTPEVANVHDSYGRSHLSSPVVFDGTGPSADGLTYSTITHSGSPTSPMEHTSDGGRHWSRVASQMVSLDPAFVPGTRTVFAAPFTWKQAGDSCSQLQRSDDGGATWRVQHIPCVHELLGTITFADARHGFAFTGGRDLLVTADGGTTWTKRTETTSIKPDQWPAPEVAFVSSTVGFALNSGQFTSRCNSWPADVCVGTLLRTGDGGRSWTDTGRTAGPISTAGDRMITAGGWRSDLAAGVAVSADGGATWHHYTAAADVRLRQLSRVANQLIAVTTAGGATSSDNGHTWSAVAQPAGAPTDDLVYARSGSAVLTTDEQGRLVRSTDGGGTWRPVGGDLGGGAHLIAAAVAFNSSDPAKAVVLAQNTAGSGDDVLLSADAGATWTTAASLHTITSGPVSYDGSVVAFGDEGVEVSTDSGRHWSERPVGGYVKATAVADNAVWAVGANGGYGGYPWKGITVAVSTDGGITWTAYTMPTFPADGFNATPGVVALSATEALLTTDGATMWRTTNSGATWRQERPNIPAS